MIVNIAFRNGTFTKYREITEANKHPHVLNLCSGDDLEIDIPWDVIGEVRYKPDDSE